MIYETAKVVNGQVVITSSKQIDQSQLTSECFYIQINGLAACNRCEFLNTRECGGKKTRKRLIDSLG